MKIKKYLALLGLPVKDKVTGFSGIATSIGFDLYGCVQVIVNPGVDKDKKPGDSRWFDFARLETTSKKRVMEPPDFDYSTYVEHGPEEKTLPDNV